MNYLIHLVLLTLLISSDYFSFGQEPSYSPEKEGVKIGVVEHRDPLPRNGIVQCFVLVTSNYTGNLVRPLTFQQSIEFVLRGTNGVPVKKTSKGKQYGQRVYANLSRYDQTRCGMLVGKNFDNDWRQLAFFKIDEVFEIKSAGNYELEVVGRLLRKDTNGLSVIKFAPVKIKLDLNDNS